MMRFGAGVAILALALAACGDGADTVAEGEGAPGGFAQGGAYQQGGFVPPGGPPSGGGGPQGGGADVQQAQQALQGLYAIRQQQCGMGNQLACQALGGFPGQGQRLNQLGQACGQGDQQACGELRATGQRLVTAYNESAQVMQAGAQGQAQMDGWRAQMNANHAGNMARLGAQAAAGQAAHQARQDAYAAQNQAWAAGQAAQDRSHGRTIDSIYEGTTVQGGGVQTFTPYGQTAYTDGYGNVAMGPENGLPPTGWEEMTPTYAAPD